MESNKALPIRLRTNVDQHDPTAIRELFAYWERLRGTRAMPSRDELDVICNAPHAAGNAFLVEVHADTPHFVLRLVGSAIEHRLGLAKGKPVEMLEMGTEIGSVLEQYERASREMRPSLCIHSWAPPEGTPVHFHQLLLPLGADGKVTHLLGCIVFFEWKTDHPKRRLL